MCGHDHAGRACALGAPADGAEIVRIADPVEHREERPLRAGQLVGIGVAIGLDQRQHALVVTGPGALGELAVGLLPRPGLGQPRLGGERPLRRPQLEHLAVPAQRLADGPPAVDEVRRH